MAGSKTPQLKLLLLENDADTRLRIRGLCDTMDVITIDAETTSIEEALTRLTDSTPDIAIVDLAGDKTFELIKKIRNSHKAIRVVVLTASDSTEDIFSAMDAGADAYVLKSNLDNALEAAIRSVTLNTVWLDPNLAKQVLDVVENATVTKTGRTLPTGMMTLPLMPDEKEMLSELATSDCKDGVCMVDSSFLKKLRRYAPDEE